MKSLFSILLIFSICCSTNCNAQHIEDSVSRNWHVDTGFKTILNTAIDSAITERVPKLKNQFPPLANERSYLVWSVIFLIIALSCLLTIYFLYKKQAKLLTKFQDNINNQIQPLLNSKAESSDLKNSYKNGQKSRDDINAEIEARISRLSEYLFKDYYNHSSKYQNLMENLSDEKKYLDYTLKNIYLPLHTLLREYEAKPLEIDDVSSHKIINNLMALGLVMNHFLKIRYGTREDVSIDNYDMSLYRAILKNQLDEFRKKVPNSGELKANKVSVLINALQTQNIKTADFSFNFFDGYILDTK